LREEEPIAEEELPAEEGSKKGLVKQEFPKKMLERKL